MGNGVLSQEEIEALLNNTLQMDQTSSQAELTEVEKDAVGELVNISMGTAATALSQLVNKKVQITTPQVDVTNSNSIKEDFPGSNLIITVKYKTGLQGFNVFILSQRDGAVIVDLMMGGDGANTSGTLNELQISGISEAMNQMMGAAATSLSSIFNLKVDITPPEVVLTEVQDPTVNKMLQESEPLVRIAFRFEVDGLVDSIMVQLIPLSIAKDMVASLMQSVKQGRGQGTAQLSPPNNTPRPVIYSKPDPDGIRQKQTPVQPVQFTPLQPGNPSTLPDNLELLLDVPLQVSVELGKAKKTIREIMTLGPGSLIELDRLAGEPVDMIVNGKLIAKCEVVVINETFGVRITDILHPSERLKNVN